MERLTQIEKVEKARKLADRGRYEEAMELIRELDVTKVKVLTDLSAIADVYEANGYTEEAYQTLRRIYEKTRTRRVLYQLAVLSVKLHNPEEAEQYYQQFLATAPEDPDQYILRFLIDRLLQKELAVQIASLERLKEYEYVEEWAYELAKLYKKAGMEDKCVRECNDIELWFGDGVIVDKALRLRDSLQPVSPVLEPEVPEVQEQEFEESEPEPEIVESTPEPVDQMPDWIEDDDVEQLEFRFDEDMNWEMPGMTILPEPNLEPESEPALEPEPESESVLEPEPEPVSVEELTVESEPEPLDPLVAVAVKILQEDDYILADEQIGWLMEFAADIRKQYKKEKRQQELMQEWTRQVIDRAERRNMGRLLDIVNKSSYRDSGLLQLTKEDFLINRD